MKDYLYLSEDDEDKFQTKFKVSKNSKIEQLIIDSKFDNALESIEEILKNDYSQDNLVLKGKILDKLSHYSDAVDCFDKALSFNDSLEIKKIKADTLYNWAKITYFPNCDYENALYLVDEALKIMPESQDLSEFYFLKAEILESLLNIVDAKKYYFKAYGQYDKVEELESQINYLENNSDCLVNISGTYFHNFTPKSGMIVNLIREANNEHDEDAIAVYLNDDKVGYVANSPHTLINNVKSASDIKDNISDDSKAEILFIFIDEYVVAKCLF